jgi:hypothetical protein
MTPISGRLFWDPPGCLATGQVVYHHSVRVTDSVIPVRVSGTGAILYLSLPRVSTENSSTWRSEHASVLHKEQIVTI